MTDKDNDQTSEEVTVETTSVFRADFLNELDAPAQAGTETAGIEASRKDPRCSSSNADPTRDRGSCSTRQ